MDVKVQPVGDGRAEWMLRDPEGYFAAERDRIRQEVDEAMALEEDARRRRGAFSRFIRRLWQTDLAGARDGALSAVQENCDRSVGW